MPAGGQVHEFVNGELLEAEEGQLGVARRKERREALAQDVGGAQVADADAAVEVLVAIDGADAAAGGAHLALGGLVIDALALALILRPAVEGGGREEEVGAIVDVQVGGVDAGGLQGGDLLPEKSKFTTVPGPSRR